MTNSEKWINYDILKKNDEFCFKKSKKYISKKKIL